MLLDDSNDKVEFQLDRVQDPVKLVDDSNSELDLDDGTNSINSEDSITRNADFISFM
jgi:hypothetical protein